MKIAALYDIHGNLPALNAVLEELEVAQPDIILVGGDDVSGPMPAQTLERLLQFGDKIRSIRGNADREVVMTFDGQPVTRKYMPAPTEKEHGTLRWVAGQLTHAQRDFLAELPEQLEIEVEGLGKVLFCHATVRNDEELFTPITPQARLNAFFPNVEQEIVVCGHTHIQFERSVGNTRIVNAGSVGMPYDDQPGACWLLLSSEGYEFRHTPYDLQTAAQEMLATGYPSVQEFVETFVLKSPTAAEATEFFEHMAEQYPSQ